MRPRSPSLAAGGDSSAADSRRVRARIPSNASESGSHSSCPALTPSCASVLAALTSFDKVELRQIARVLLPRLQEDLAAKPPRGTPIASLAKVELQLIMRCCDRVSLIALARCSRTTLAAASSDFAWSGSLLRVRSCTPQLAERLSSCLLRFADVYVWWTRDMSGSPFVAPWDFSERTASDDELAAIASVARLRGLDCTERNVSSKKQERLLSRAGCSQLTELRIQQLQDADISPSLLRALPRRQPLLRTFYLKLSTEPFSMPSALTSLSQLQHLTELRVDSPYNHANHDYSFVAECRNLRTLSLWGPCVELPSVLSSPALQSVRTLELHYVPLVLVPESSLSLWQTALANLHALESLLLECCRGMDELLRLLSASQTRSLRYLRVRMAIYRDDPTMTIVRQQGEPPSDATLRACLQQLPQMHLQLEMNFRRACASIREDSNGAHPQWDAANAVFTRLAEEFPERVHFNNTQYVNVR